jgi:thioredoxin reductase (NADPH)
MLIFYNLFVRVIIQMNKQVTAVIIGGGPAGCQCALWLHKLGYDSIIVEQTNKLGGLQNRSPYINDWIVGVMDLQGQELAKNIQHHVEQLPIPIYFNNIVTAVTKLPQGGFTVQIGAEIINTHNIVVATGVKPRSDHLVEAENIIIGPGKKVEDYPFADKRVAILGGGDNAAECYELIKKKAPRVRHIYARNIRARRNLWNLINATDVYLGQYNIDQITMTITSHEVKKNYDVFVVLYGWEANFPIALESMKANLINEQSFFIADQLRHTKIPGIFAIGEVAHCVHPCVVTSMADGVIAAKAIEAQLEKTSR